VLQPASRGPGMPGGHGMNAADCRRQPAPMALQRAPPEQQSLQLQSVPHFVTQLAL
jgi:hypothetical protein